MSGKKTKDKKQLIMILSAVFFIVVIVILVFLLKRNQDTFEYEGWINCQPILSPQEADLCRRAEAANYPYIAY